MDTRTYEDGTLSRGEWKLEDGSLHYCAESFEEAERIARELRSLGGCAIEKQGAYLSARVQLSEDSDPLAEFEHSEQALEAVRELRRAGFGVSGDFDGAPFLFHVETLSALTTEQGTYRLRYASALEDEARERYNALRESDGLTGAQLSRFDPEDGSREVLEACAIDPSGESLAQLALSGKIRGEVYEVRSDRLEGYSGLGWDSMDRHGRSSECVLDCMREGTARFVFVSDRACGSNYGGDGAVGKSNLRALLELAKENGLAEGSDFWELSGAHDSYGVAFRAGLRCAALSDAFLAMEDYPLLDEDLHSEIECEEQSEAWDSYVRSDFLRALESRESVEIPDDRDGEDPIRELFETARERSNTYFEHSSEGASIDVDRIVESVTRAEVLALPGAVREDEAEQAEALAQLSKARPCFDKLEDEAEAEPSERAPYSLPEAVEAVRVALGAPSSLVLGDCAEFLSQVSRWPIGQHPASDCHSPIISDVRAELATLRRHVGNVVQSARMRLAELDPARAERDTKARGAYAALPRETDPLP